jgi:integrase
VQDHHDRASAARRELPSGVEIHHGAGCARKGERIKCSCAASYRGVVYDKTARKHVRGPWRGGKGGLSEAKSWLVDKRHQLAKGTLTTPTKLTLQTAWAQWYEGALNGTVRRKGEQTYKPSALRSYEIAMRRRILPEIGSSKVTDIRRSHLQGIADRMLAAGCSPSSVKNTIIPLRCIFRRLIEDEVLTFNPVSNLRIPPAEGRRDRVASPEEAVKLIAALPAIADRALWATAIYSGLRRGELRGLQWADVSLATGILSVSRGWDDVQGPISPKSQSGKRTVPVVATLRDHLDQWKLASERDGTDLVFGRSSTKPFDPGAVNQRAARAWAQTCRTCGHTADDHDDDTCAKFEALLGIRLHECRHTFVTLMFEAGLSLERIGDYVGHSSTYMTDRYRHLLEGHEDETRKQFDAYLALANTQARLEQLDEVES